MHCTVLISGLLPFPPGLHPRAVALEQFLARGDLQRCPPFDHDIWLCKTFGIQKQNDWPLAPLLLRSDGIDPQQDFWLCANPVHLRADRSRLILAQAAHDLTLDEAASLIAGLNEHFARDGLIFYLSPAGAWYLRVRSQALSRDITTTPLQAAIGQNIDALLPRGQDALDWHRILNEIQMVLHAHPINEARETRAAFPINSVWLWGGGTMSAQSLAPYQSVWSNDAVTRALAYGVHHALPRDGPRWLAQPPSGHHVLLVFNMLESAAAAGDLNAWQSALMQFDRDWIVTLTDALRARKLTGVRVLMSGHERAFEIELTRAHLKRWWRRTRRLAEQLSPEHDA